MTANRPEWESLLRKTGIAYERTKRSCDFIVQGRGDTNNQRVHIWFDAVGEFENIELFYTDKSAKELINPSATIFDWTKLLDKSKVYHASQKFCNGNKWCSYWEEIPCNPGMILRLSHGSPHNDPKIFAISVESR